MKRSHEEYLIESHEEWTSYLQLFIYLSSCLDELSWEFKSILDFNILTQLKYSIQTSWLNLNTWFQNSDLNWVLMSWKPDLISITQFNVISLFRLINVVQLTMTFTLVKFIWRSCSDTMTFKKIFSSTLNLLRAYQGWIELVSASSSDLTQSLFSFINISLFNIIFLSTSHSTRVTNTFSSSLAQSLNIT